MRLVALAVFAGGALAGASATTPLGDTDMYWHLANAIQMSAHGLVRTDTYSWTAPGAPVPTDQWLGEALFGLGYGAAGWLGVVLVRTLGVAVLVSAIALAAFTRRPRAPVVALGVALPAIVLSRFIWTERPELLGIACFALLVFLLQLGGTRPLYVVAPLLIVWANVHGSFALGAGLVLVVSAYGAWRDPGLRRGYAVAAAGALLAFLLTPAGPGTLATPGTHFFSPPREIEEWAPPDVATAPGAVWALVLLVTVATAATAGGARWRDVVLIAPVAMLSLVAIRHTPLFAIAATPYLADRLPVAIARITGRTLPERSPRPIRTALAALPAAAGLVLLAMGVAIAPREPDESMYPVGALAVLPSGPGVLAEYDWGGWLIWHAPATPVFVDGRLGPYRGRILADHTRVIEAAPGWREVLARRGVRSLLVRPTDPVAVRATELGWTVISRSSRYLLIAVEGSPR